MSKIEGLVQPTAPLGGGFGLLRDVEGFSTEALMKQKKADSTTNEHKPSSTVDFEQGGHKGE